MENLDLVAGLSWNCFGGTSGGVGDDLNLFGGQGLTDFWMQPDAKFNAKLNINL